MDNFRGWRVIEGECVRVGGKFERTYRKIIEKKNAYCAIFFFGSPIVPFTSSGRRRESPSRLIQISDYMMKFPLACCPRQPRWEGNEHRTTFSLKMRYQVNKIFFWNWKTRYRMPPSTRQCFKRTFHQTLTSYWLYAASKMIEERHRTRHGMFALPE